MYREPPPGHQTGRRDSIPCPTSPAHALRPSTFRDAEPVTTSCRQPRPVSRASEDQRACAPTTQSVSMHSTPSTSVNIHSSIQSEQDIQYDIYNHILALAEPAGVDASVWFERADMDPPITAESLAELDMHRIINNPKLRHDVNFDRDLHFRPNLDGSKGRQKMQAADHYWKALETEFAMYNLCSVHLHDAADEPTLLYWRRVMHGSHRRLRRIFEVICDVLVTLVPDHEQSAILARLDVGLIMQQISNGVCDLVDLSNWLAALLKAHCAPMRDAYVEVMKQDLHVGAHENNNQKLVNGLRRLLAILEAMRLDVANHQIRHMRPLLIEDTVSFHQRYNAQRMAMGAKLDVLTARNWFDAEADLLADRGLRCTPVQVFTSALFRDLLFNEMNAYPQTFYLDLERLRLMRISLHGGVYLAICQGILSDLLPETTSKTVVDEALLTLQTSVTAVAGTNGRFCERLENIAAEIVRVLSTVEKRASQCDSTLSDFVEARLGSEFAMASPSFEMHSNVLCNRLLPKLQDSVQQHCNMTALDLQNALLPKPLAKQSPTPGFGAVCSPPLIDESQSPDTELIRRLTHVICLHWQVWGDLVYLAPLREIAMTDYDPVLRSSQSASPPLSDTGRMYASGTSRTQTRSNAHAGGSSVPTPSRTPTLSATLTSSDDQIEGEMIAEQSSLNMETPPST